MMPDPKHLEDCDGNGSVPCWECMGDGSYHDCGEDTCCCEFPEMDGRADCANCGGSGVIRCPACLAEEVLSEGDPLP